MICNDLMWEPNNKSSKIYYELLRFTMVITCICICTGQCEQPGAINDYYFGGIVLISPISGHGLGMVYGIGFTKLL